MTRPGERTPSRLDPWIQEMIRHGEFGKAIAGIAMAAPEGLLRDAEKVFAGGMDEAASLICRAAMETAMYIFLFTEPTIGSTDPGALELRPSERRGYEALYHKVAGAEILSASERDRLWMIGDHGDTVAHLAERFHKALLAAMKKDSDIDFPYPTHDDVRKNLEAAKSITSKFTERLADKIQSVAEAKLGAK